LKRSSTLVFEKRPEDNLTWPELFGARVGVVRKIGLVSVNSNKNMVTIHRRKPMENKALSIRQSLIYLGINNKTIVLFFLILTIYKYGTNMLY